MAVAAICYVLLVVSVATLIWAALYLSPSRWWHNDKCAKCGRAYRFYRSKNNLCPCFKKNPNGAVCGLYCDPNWEPPCAS